MILPCPRKHFRGQGHLCVAGKRRFQARLWKGLNRAVGWSYAIVILKLNKS